MEDIFRNQRLYFAWQHCECLIVTCYCDAKKFACLVFIKQMYLVHVGFTKIWQQGPSHRQMSTLDAIDGLELHLLLTSLPPVPRFIVSRGDHYCTLGTKADTTLMLCSLDAFSNFH